MRPEYAELIQRRLAVPLVEGPDKVTTLEAAVRRLVEPGQTIYAGAAHGRPNALVRELVRQWWGRSPGWTLALTGIGSPWSALIIGGLVKRLLTTFVGEGYPFPAPQPLVAEAIVTTDFIRRHAGFVRLPAQYVAAVVEAPLGAHPAGMYGMNLPELEGYAEDPEFILELRRAFRQLETARAWIREWMLEVPDQVGYLAKLGYERIMEVKGRAHTDAWVSELEMLEGRLGPDECQSDAERMVVAAARLLSEKVRAKGYRAYLSGVGNSNLAAWLSALELKAEGVDVELMAETGMLGFLPRPAEPFVFSFRNFPSSKMLTDIVHVMGIFMGGRENRCIGSLAAGQSDKHGNINSTIVPGVTYITGSGGANDIASSAREVVVTLAQRRNRFVDKVPS